MHLVCSSCVWSCLSQGIGMLPGTSGKRLSLPLDCLTGAGVGAPGKLCLGPGHPLPGREICSLWLMQYSRAWEHQQIQDLLTFPKKSHACLIVTEHSEPSSSSSYSHAVLCFPHLSFIQHLGCNYWATSVLRSGLWRKHEKENI